MFVLLRVGPNLAQNVHSQKSIFYFLTSLDRGCATVCGWGQSWVDLQQ
jgi:hypothetical protein